MAQKPWKDDPVAWEKLYDDQHVVSLASLGFPQFERTRIVAEKKPEIFRSLESMVQKHWAAVKAENPKVFNSVKNGVRGKEALDVDGKDLVIHVYESDFASLIYNLSRGEEENSLLTPEQRQFLDNHLHFLGVTGYMQLNGLYLAGKAAGLKLKSGLWEFVPSGFVDHGMNCDGALTTELRQETGLYFQRDIMTMTPTHMNFSPKYGNCTVIYKLSAVSDVPQRVKCSSEHQRLDWLTPQWMMKRENRYTISPPPLKIIEDLHGGKQ